jgi:predicted RNase H-like HicB family nuclease
LTEYTTETEIVTAFTTYCPEPTTIITNGKTITVSEATTITITDCPCILTRTIPIHITTTTEVVTAFTTYCPEPTTIITNGKTITVDKPTTITITDCPCTLTKTIPLHVTTEIEGKTETTCETLCPTTEVPGVTHTPSKPEHSKPSCTTCNTITHTKAAVTLSTSTKSGVTKPTVEVAPNGAIGLTPSLMGMAVAGIMLL